MQGPEFQPFVFVWTIPTSWIMCPKSYSSGWTSTEWVDRWKFPGSFLISNLNQMCALRYLEMFMWITWLQRGTLLGWCPAVFSLCSLPFPLRAVLDHPGVDWLIGFVIFQRQKIRSSSLLKKFSVIMEWFRQLKLLGIINNCAKRGISKKLLWNKTGGN